MGGQSPSLTDLLFLKCLNEAETNIQWWSYNLRATLLSYNFDTKKIMDDHYHECYTKEEMVYTCSLSLAAVVAIIIT
jgi:hypothetical protein